MADGTVLSTPSGVGDTVATDDLGAFGKVQWVKLVDGTNGGTGLIAGDAANGLDVDVTRLPSLPAGANAIGKLAANSGVDIGDVDVLTVPGTVADNAAALPAVLYVVGGWDGTNVQALSTDASGILQVDVVGDSATQAGAAARTADFDTGAGTVTTVFNGIALPANGGPVAGGTSTNPLRTDTTGTTTQPVSDAGGSLTVDNGGTFAVQIAANSSVNQAQIAGTATDVNSGVKSAGTQRVVLATDQPALTNALKVDGSAVTQPVSGPLTDAQLRAAVVPVQDVGNVAHDGADSGNPVKVGARALTADITAVAANDRVDAIATTLGKQVTQPYALPGQSTNGMLATALTGTTAADVIAAPGANIRLCITEITVTNNHATVGTKVEIRDGTTVKKVISCPALGGGASISMPTPLRLTANTALTCRPVTTGADIDCSATGFTALE